MKWIRKSVFLILIVTVIVACDVSTPVSINTATSSSLTATLSSTTAMVVNTPSFTPTFTPTTTFTPTPIPTDLPTLSPEEAQATVLRLLSQSDACKLPCWWGVIPGKMKWEEVYPFFKQFASKVTSAAPTIKCGQKVLGFVFQAKEHDYGKANQAAAFSSWREEIVVYETA